MARCWWLCLAAGLWASAWAVWAVAPSRPESHDALESLPAGAVGRCGGERFRLRKTDALIGIALHGGLIAVNRQDHRVELLDVATGKVVRSLGSLISNPLQRQHESLTAAFSPIGQHLALRIPGQEMGLLHNTHTGKTQETILFGVHEWVRLDQHGRRLLAVPMPPNLVTSSERTHLTLFNLTTGDSIWKTPIPKDASIGGALSWDGAVVAFWTVPIHLSDYRKMKWCMEIESMEGRTAPVRVPMQGPCATAAFSPDGKTLAVVEQARDSYGARQATLRLITPGTGKETARFQADTFTNLTFSPSGRYLIGSGSKELFRVWDLQVGKWLPVRTIPGVQLPTFGFLKDGQILGCGQVGQQIVVWNIQTGQIFSPSAGPHAMVSSLRFSAPDRILTASVAGEFTEWDLRGRIVRHNHLGVRLGAPFRFGDISEPELSPAGTLIVDSTGAFFHQSTGEPAPEFSRPLTNPTFSCFSEDDSLVARVDGNALEILNTVSFKKVHLELPHKRDFGTVALSAERRLCAVVVWEADSTWDVRLYDLRTRDLVKRLAPIPCDSSTALKFAPGGEYLLTASSFPWVQLLELRTGQLLREFACDRRVGNVIVFAPQGLAFVVSHQDARDTITVFEGWSGKTRRTFHPPNKAVALAFSSDGRFLASGQETGTVYIWDMEDPVAKCPATVDLAWNALQSDDAQEAWRGIQTLVRSPDQALPLLRRTLRPLPEKLLSAAELARLIADLDHPEFAMRNRTEAILVFRQREVSDHLKQALEKNTGLEVRQRLRRLLARPYAPSRELIPSLRAIEVLERIGSREAKQLLAHLAGGYSLSLFTIEANAALARLGRK